MPRHKATKNTVFTGRLEVLILNFGSTEIFCQQEKLGTVIEMAYNAILVKEPNLVQLDGKKIKFRIVNFMPEVGKLIVQKNS